MIESYRRAVERHRDEIARLQREKSREASSAAAETNRAHSAAESANRSTSMSTIQSRLRDAQRHEERAARHYSKVADIERKIADEHRRLNDAERRLDQAVQAADKKRAQEQARSKQDHDRRMREIDQTLQRHTSLHTVAAQAIKRLQDLPKEITVLFLAANPLDQQPLRLDEEVRAIEDMIRRSEHRDAVRLVSRWAVRPLDVLQAINELTPRIVHFSGHGTDQEEIAFQDSSGATKLVSKAAIAQTLAATTGDIQLVFFNACYSRAQAEAVVEHVPAAIGMNTSIGDDAARVFAAQFYSAIGFGLSLAKAFEQARAALMLEGIAEEDTPELFVTPGLDPRDLVLVSQG